MDRILLADDDQSLTSMLCEYLTTEGFEVSTVGDGAAALRQAREKDFDLVVLDVMMPLMNGFDVLRAIRETSMLPILILSARGDDVDSIVGLELGADDYLAKPCNPRILVARIRAILRRSNEPSQTADDVHNAPFSVQDLEIKPGSRSVLCAGRPVILTSTEFSVLLVLVRQAGQVVDKDNLSQQALGRRLDRYDRSLDMHISKLRKKLGSQATGEERIKTVRGVGYQYVCSDE